MHAAKRNIAPDVDFALLARRTPGFTGADLASVMNEAVLLAIRDGSDEAMIASRHLSEAVQRVLHGPHRGKLLAPERARIAVHESGHAMVAAACGRGGDAPAPAAPTTTAASARWRRLPPCPALRRQLPLRRPVER